MITATAVKKTKTKTETKAPKEISPLRAYGIVSKAYEEAKEIGDNALLGAGTFDAYIWFEKTFRQCLVERIGRAGLASTPWGATGNDVSAVREQASKHWFRKCFKFKSVKSVKKAVKA